MCSHSTVGRKNLASARPGIKLSTAMATLSRFVLDLFGFEPPIVALIATGQGQAAPMNLVALLHNPICATSETWVSVLLHSDSRFCHA